MLFPYLSSIGLQIKILNKKSEIYNTRSWTQIKIGDMQYKVWNSNQRSSLYLYHKSPNTIIFLLKLEPPPPLCYWNGWFSEIGGTTTIALRKPSQNHQRFWKSSFIYRISSNFFFHHWLEVGVYVLGFDFYIWFWFHFMFSFNNFGSWLWLDFDFGIRRWSSFDFSDLILGCHMMKLMMWAMVVSE